MGEIETQTDESFIPDPTLLQVQITIEKLKKYQRRFFRGGKGGQASLTFYQSTNKIIAVFIPDFMSYMKMSRLIKRSFSYLY